MLKIKQTKLKHNIGIYQKNFATCRIKFENIKESVLIPLHWGSNCVLVFCFQFYDSCTAVIFLKITCKRDNEMSKYFDSFYQCNLKLLYNCTSYKIGPYLSCDPTTVGSCDPSIVGSYFCVLYTFLIKYYYYIASAVLLFLMLYKVFIDLCINSGIFIRFFRVSP